MVRTLARALSVKMPRPWEGGDQLTVAGNHPDGRCAALICMHGDTHGMVTISQYKHPPQKTRNRPYEERWGKVDGYVNTMVDVVTGK